VKGHEAAGFLLYMGDRDSPVGGVKVTADVHLVGGDWSLSGGV